MALQNIKIEKSCYKIAFFVFLFVCLFQRKIKEDAGNHNITKYRVDRQN